MKCPKCGTECARDDVDIGVGMLYGPWGCPGCGWSEDSEYDLTIQEPVDAKGGAKDQYGGYHPPDSSMALAYRIAQQMQKKADGEEP